MSYAICAYQVFLEWLAPGIDFFFRFGLGFFNRNKLKEPNQMFNFSQKKIGGIRFIKLGRFCFSFCVTSQYKELV